jgi:peptide/nickel transport system substrate-binding protein
MSVRTRGRSGSPRKLGALVAVALILAACGGTKHASKTSTDQTADTTTTVANTGATETTSPGPSTSDTSSGNAAVTTTTRASTATTASKAAAKKTTASAAIAKNQTRTAPTVSGIENVTATTAAPAGEQIQPGGTLTVLFNAETNGFDPTKGTGSASGTGDAQRMFAVYDALVFQDPKSGSVVPSVAQSMTSADAKTWTLKIRPNVKFTDGTPYDANAVKFNWDRHADPANGSIQAAVFKTFTYRVVDNLTLEIALSSANGQFPRVIARQITYVASPTAIQAAGPGTAYNNAKPVGAGPFTLDSWTRNSQMVLVRNPNYWNAPRPYLDQLVFKVITDVSQRDNTFKSGTGDVSVGSPTTINDMSKSGNVYPSPALNTQGLGFQEGHAPFNDKTVRQAIMLAFDVDEYNRVINGNVFETAHTAFPSNYPFTDPSIAWPKTDLVSAQKLIDNYIATKNGGKDVTFSYTYISPTDDTAAQLIQAQIQRVNHVKMTLKPETVNQLVTDITTKNFDMSTYSYNGVDPEPEFINLGLCKGSSNFWDYCNTDMDNALTVARTSLDPASRNQALKQAQQIAINDALYFPRSHSMFLLLYNNKVQDLATFDDGGLLFDRIWLKR